MGLFDIFRRQDIATARSALQEAHDPQGKTDAITATIQRILALGLDGKAFLKGAHTVADDALRAADGDTERAIDALARGGVRLAAGGGFVTGLGGFVTMPVALPANLLGFYVVATRTVGAIAKLRGYDIDDPTIRSAILLALVGARSTDILNKAGISIGTNALGGLASSRLPAAALMMINKAVGFRLLRSIGAKTFARFGRAVPLIGGIVGAVVDGAMLSRIAEHARVEFPTSTAEARRAWGVR
nr:EcsC family protein [Propionibacterium sp.]